MCNRPGQASVQYDDLRGEVVADFFRDVDANTCMRQIAKEMGWEGKGRIVGMRLSIHERKVDKTTLHCFNMTLQIVKEYSVDILKKTIKESSGVLLVREETIPNVDISNILKYFKRFEIGLFINSLKPDSIEVEN